MRKLFFFPLLLSTLALIGCATPGQTLLAGMLVYTIADYAAQKANRTCEEGGKQQEPQQYAVQRVASPAPALATGPSADLRLREGLAAYREFRYTDCRREMSRVIDDRAASSAERASAYMFRGACSYLLNDLDGARRDFWAANRLRGRMPESLFRPDIVTVYRNCAGDRV